MAKVDLREASKVKWVTDAGNNNYPGDHNIQLGCLMRIADASEAMAKRHTDLIDENARLCRYIKSLESSLAAERNTIKGLRNRVTRLTKQLAVKV